MSYYALYDMSPSEREEFEMDCASAWVDRQRDQQDEEQRERDEQRRRQKEPRDE